jgi:hypothetical protein
MSVGDEYVAIGGDQHGGRGIELVGAAAGHADLAEGQQHFALGTELEDLVALAVLADAIRHPHVSCAVHREAMRQHEHAGTEALYQIAVLVELQDRREARAFAAERNAGLHGRWRREGAAALSYPDAFAVGVDRDAGRGAPGPAIGKLSERHPDIRIGQRIGRCHGLRIGRAGRCREQRHGKAE